MRAGPVEEREKGGRVAVEGGAGKNGVNDRWG